MVAPRRSAGKTSKSKAPPRRTIPPTDDDLRSALTSLIAIERDRLLGYNDDDLHKQPRRALQDALDALEAADVDTDRIVFPDDKNTLDLD